jgi:hypothetical protein
MMWPEFGTPASAMRFRFVLHLPGFAAASLLGSCAAAVQGPVDFVSNMTAGDPAARYIGMTKSEVIACAGNPHSNYDSGGDQVLTYHYSGPGPVPKPEPKKSDDKKPTGPFSNVGSKDKGSWDCTASFVFENDKLVRVNFAHKNVDSPYAWQKIKDPEKAEKKREEGVPTCQFSLPNCPR